MDALKTVEGELRAEGVVRDLRRDAARLSARANQIADALADSKLEGFW
jgi:hypothetical protein